MLQSPKKPVLMPSEQTHVDLFVEHYEQLKSWAFRFTEYDKELANDLLHDTFIHFTLNKPDLDSIENVEGYLFVVMRNLHLSQLRRATRSPIRDLTVVDYDMIDIPLWSSDPRDRLRMRDDLSAVCQFACVRKESSKGGSILILRFFHGYFPGEIASMVVSKRGAIDEALRTVRAEAKLYLEDPNRLSFIADQRPMPTKSHGTSAGSDIRVEFRKQIFASRQGECLQDDTLHALYKSENPEAPDQKTLAHIVSCPICIEAVNSLLGLPPLASRYPLDTIGKDPGKKGGSGGGGGAGGPKMILDSFVNRRDLHFYHEPQELCISVNGQFQSLQRIVSGKGELVLVLDTNESLGFIEVFSEQGLRLLMMNVQPPPAGDGKQSAHVDLSYGRTIDANLSFSGAFPALHVAYNDPSAALHAAIEKNPAGTTEKSTQQIVAPLKPKKPRITSLFAGWKSWLQPARITAAFAVLIVAALLILKFAPTGHVSAAELLQKSAETEEAKLSNKDRILHRTIDLEERNSGGDLIGRRHIDVWQSAEKGVTARRLYDEAGALVMGDWRRTDGIQTIYKRGDAAMLQPLPEKRTAAIAFDDAWQLSLSAKEFLALLDNIDQAQVENRGNNYFISYNPQFNNNPYGIVNASIVLNRDDLHAIEQTFTLRNGDETREFRMIEAGYDWRPTSTVAPAVFEPNLELTGTAKSDTAPTVADSNTNASEQLATNTNSGPTANIATPALQVEVIEALNNAGAFMGEQVSVSNTQDGKILVSALVETDQRKKELLAALASVRSNLAVRINIETVAEVQARQKRSPGSATQTITIDRVDPSEDSNPVYAELKRRFSDDEARQFAANVINRSHQARLHALAAKQLSDRFSLADLQALSPTERGRWLGLIRGHAEKFLGETQSLQRELQQFFPEAATGASGGGTISNDSELQAKVRELFEVSDALERGLGQSFALTAGQSGTMPVKTVAFWRTFATAVGLARSISIAK